MENPIQSQLGEVEITKMVAAFYRRVRADDLLSSLYPSDDWEGSEQRLRDFLIFRFGGSDRYLQLRGHPRLGMRHAPFRIGIAERDRWLELMDVAMGEAEIPPATRRDVNAFFGQVAEFLRNS